MKIFYSAFCQSTFPPYVIRQSQCMRAERAVLIQCLFCRTEMHCTSHAFSPLGLRSDRAAVQNRLDFKSSIDLSQLLFALALV